jgi:N6-adenosine-specific RNA methylase IME4
MIEGWGWRYETTMVWHKIGGHQSPNRPQYNLEFIVVASRGSPQYADIRDFLACFNAYRRDHSRKPEEFFETLRRVTAGPRLELFARRPHDGFEPHGDEIDWSTGTQPAITVESTATNLNQFLQSSIDLSQFHERLHRDIANASNLTEWITSA